MKLQPIRKEKLPRRNEKCPCGSGKKAKKCCLKKIKAFAALPPHLREQVVVAKILGHLSMPQAAVPPTGPTTVQIADSNTPEPATS